MTDDGNDGRGDAYRRLIPSAKARGHVTISELHAGLPDAPDLQLILDVVEILHELGIEIVDDQHHRPFGEPQSMQGGDARRHIHRVAMQVLAQLTERERQILKSRFGIDPEKSVSLAEAERRFFATRERIRAIEAKALSKLRRRDLRDDDDDPDGDKT